MFRSNNVAARIFQRQISTPAPGTTFNCARRFYENIVPSYTIYNLECPDHMLRKFTEDGLYLVTFNRNHQELVVYRPTGLSYSYKGEEINAEQLPPKCNKFESFFTQLYTVSLTSIGELICKEFFLYIESKKFGLFATSTAPIHDAPSVGGAIQGVPCIDTIKFHLLRMEDGVILGERVFRNDYVNLVHSNGVFLYDDLLAIVSLRYQQIHILQIRDSGNLVDLRAIGKFCREDDELLVNSSNQVNPAGNLLHNDPSAAENSFLSGIKQRLLTFIYRGICNEEQNPATRTQYQKKKFYFHFQDYVNLVIWKVQFLDRQHLLIKFGSVDGGVSRNPENHPAFFAVYNMETTEIVSFYQNSPEELYVMVELFCDFFHASPANSLTMNFISSHSNNIHACEQLKYSKNKASNFSQFVKRILSNLPFACQSLSPSPYFDQTLFRFDEKLISAIERPRQSTEHPIKFISRRKPNIVKFKIKPGPEAGNTDTRTRKISSFLFHPILPLVLSVQQTVFLQPSVVNIHFRR